MGARPRAQYFSAATDGHLAAFVRWLEDDPGRPHTQSASVRVAGRPAIKGPNFNRRGRVNTSMATAFYIGADESGSTSVNFLLSRRGLMKPGEKYGFASAVHSSLVSEGIISARDTSVLFVPDTDGKYATVVVQIAPAADVQFTAARLKSSVLWLTDPGNPMPETTVEMVADVEVGADPPRLYARPRTAGTREVGAHLASLTVDSFSLDGLCRIRLAADK